jgi:inward rectifier potassium channel
MRMSRHLIGSANFIYGLSVSCELSTLKDMHRKTSHHRAPKGPAAVTLSRSLNRDGAYNVSHAGWMSLKPSDLYHSLLSLSSISFILILVATYFFVNLTFGLAYYLCGPGALENIHASTFVLRFEDCFFFSVQTLATIGYGRITPVGIIPNLLVTLEALVGLLGLAIATGLLFARFSRPTARVVFSKVALMSEHEGVLSLVFRIANARFNQIVQAEISVWLLRSETTTEGETYRNFYEMKLERSRSPIFALSWTIVHPIDADSPLFGLSQAAIQESNAEVIVVLAGIDDTFSQTIHARYSYRTRDLVWNGYFVDVLSRTEDGKLLVELDKLHQIHPKAEELK